MAGYFELVDAPDGGYRIRLLDGIGSADGGVCHLPDEARSRGRAWPCPRDCRHGPDPRYCKGAVVAARATAFRVRLEGGYGRRRTLADAARAVRVHWAAKACPARLKGGAVLFDVDGTLVDSAYIHTLAWWQAFRQSGFDVPMAADPPLRGNGRCAAGGPPAAGGRDKAVDEDVLAAHSGIFGTYWPSLRAFDGARDLLAQCYESGLAVALASSRQGSGPQGPPLAALAADSFIDAATSANDAKESKPEPDILVAALRAVGIQASDAVYVGDAVWDVYAASQAGHPHHRRYLRRHERGGTPRSGRRRSLRRAAGPAG